MTTDASQKNYCDASDYLLHLGLLLEKNDPMTAGIIAFEHHGCFFK